MTTSDMMIEHETTPTWLRIVSVIGVVWYAFGLLQFWLGYSMDTAELVGAGAITAEHGAAIDGTPPLIWLAFAIASASGLVGSISLFSRSTMAKSIYALSLASAAVYYAWVYVISGTGADRPAEEIIIAAVVLTITFGFLILSRKAS